MTGTVAPLDPERHLRRALELAARGRAGTSPNPMVGAVLVKDGAEVGAGWHRRAGGPHAEVEALRDAGEAARGADLYVTLEPCSHHGKTPPCADAVVDAGIRRVIACHADPNPLVAGRGFSRLASAGIEVRVGFLEEEEARLNWRFHTSMIHHRPGVTLKWAMTLDGKIATRTGHSQWISSPEGRQWAHEERDEHDAILVGSGTVLADDPRLDRRSGRLNEPINRVVLDRRLRTPPTARLFTAPGPVLIFTTMCPDDEKVTALRSAGADVITLERVDPPAVLGELHERRLRSVLVEGGGDVHAAFVESRAFDRVAVNLAPRLIGGREAPGPLGGLGVEHLEDGPEIETWKIDRRGRDLVLEGLRKGCLRDLCAHWER